MKIALTSKGIGWDAPMDPRFGRAAYVMIYDEASDTLTEYDNRETAEAAHGAGPQLAQQIGELKPDVLITGNGPGDNALLVLKTLGLKIYTGAGEMTVREAYQAWQKQKLTQMQP